MSRLRELNLKGRSGQGGLGGVPSFAYTMAEPKVVYFEDFMRGIAASTTAGAGGGEWYYSRAGSAETVGLQNLEGGALGINGTTDTNRLTLQPNPRVAAGGGIIGSLGTVGVNTHFATRFQMPTTSCIGFVGIGTVGTTHGFTVSGFGGLTSGFGFYFDGTDLLGTVVAGGSVVAGHPVTLQATYTTATMYKCEVIVTGTDGTGANFAWYVNGVNVANSTSVTVGTGNHTIFMEMSQTVTAARTMAVDYLYLQRKLSAAR